MCHFHAFNFKYDIRVTKMKQSILNYFGDTKNLQKSKSGNFNRKQSIKRKSKVVDNDVIIISSDEENATFSSKPIVTKKRKLSKSTEQKTSKDIKLQSPFGSLKANKSDDSSSLSSKPSAKEKSVAKIDPKLADKSETQKADITIIDTNSNVMQDQEEKSQTEKTVEDEEEEVGNLPYYLSNFQLVIDTVMGNEDDASLFIGDDAHWIDKFKTLNISAKKLYVRLFHRKSAWLQLHKISYKEIADDISRVLKILVEENFLQHNMSECESPLTLNEVLHLLPAPDIKVIAKRLHISVSEQKDQLCSSIEKLCKKQRSLFASANKSLQQTVLKQALNLLGPCYKVALPPKRAFNRLLLVFDVTKGTEDDAEYSLARGSNQPPYYGKNQQLSAILMAGMGKVIYPAYQINRPTPVFKSRCELLEYETAYHLMSDALNASESADWKLAFEICEKANIIYQSLSQESKDRALTLPHFLRGFTASTIFVRIKSLQVEVLQKTKDYNSATLVLKDLLAQHDFCMHRRGYWTERLALNLNQHLKDPCAALDVIKEGVKDKYVRVGHIASLGERAEKIKSSNKVQYEDFDEILKQCTLLKANEITIVGRLLPKRMQTGKARFMKQNENHLDTDDVLLCSVEELALDHYKNEGYDQGLHGEGGTFTCFFCLLFWDIIFMPGIADVFRTPYQTHPLDYNTDEFYANRKPQILERLQQIVSWEGEDFSVKNTIAKSWDLYKDVACLGMNWDRFSSVEHALVLAECIGGHVLSGIMKILAKDPRHTRSGLPDLVVWNADAKTYKFVEVKGPGDRLSNNQKVWMHELVKLDANVEICHVTANASRKLTR